MTYIVHGATGAQGAPLLKRLTQSGKQTFAAVRHTENLPNTPTVEVDNASVDSLIAAYRGADGVFFHLPMGREADKVVYARNVIQAVKVAKPGRVVVSTSGSTIDDPNSPLQVPADSAIAILVEGLKTTGVSTAIIATRVYLENLLLPLVFDPVRSEGILRYPINADIPVSWSSHLDVAEVAEHLLNRPEITGIVGVGHLPGILGAELAEGLSRYFDRPVRFENMEPQEFGKLLQPLLGPASGAVTEFYQAMWRSNGNTISAATSAQRLLNVTPRTVEKWLAEVLA